MARSLERINLFPQEHILSFTEKGGKYENGRCASPERVPNTELDDMSKIICLRKFEFI